MKGLFSLALIQHTEPPPQNGSWSKPPEVVICSELTLSKKRLVEAIRLWKEEGYTFSIIYWNYSGPECYRGYIDGAIRLCFCSTRANVCAFGPYRLCLGVMSMAPSMYPL